MNYEIDSLKQKIELTMNELFSGIGAQKRGIDNTGLFDCEVICTSDIDKDAMLSYAAIHCGLTPELIENYESPSAEEMAEYLDSLNIGYGFEKGKAYDWYKKLKSKDLKKYYLACVLSKNMGNISKIDELPYADLWTYSFPCTDISVAGRQAGIIKGKTRSGLLYEIERLLNKAAETNTLPKYLLLENVKNLVGKKFKPQFDDWVTYLDNMGFNTYYQVINAKDCGIPQNRERVFAISIRKDIDTKKFTFPKPFDNGMRLKDILEDEVDEKYYINSDASKKLIQELLDNGTIGNATGVAQRGRYTDDNSTEQQIEVRNDENANCITSVSKDSMVVDTPACFRYERTEEGKALRKQYETHEIHHGFNEYRDLKPRKDGISNTVSTVLKDNLTLTSERERERESNRKTIDLSLNEPREIDTANCITSRYDGGVSTIRQYRTGVVETNSNVSNELPQD